MNLLFLTFGPNIKNHYQANFAIMSFLPFQKELDTIYVYTDYPQYYTRLKEHVQVVTITPEQLTAWKGPHDFFWRVKIKAIEQLICQHPDQAVMYVDSDVFLYQSPQELRTLIRSGAAFMHQPEGKLSALKSKTEKRMWQQVKGLRVGALQLHANHVMWNAGVVTLPVQQNLAAVTLALQICDAMCAQQVTPRLIEQFALSVALQETYNLQEAKPWIAHYWGNKDEWNSHISQFFLESHLKGFTVEQDIARLQQFQYKSLALVTRNKKTRARLIQAIDLLFPPKNQTFIEQ
ncbi:hypothetical protein ACFSC6_03915 [Rufibacter sediminis]|uniref:Nucleotide-diphospho-sugar transferase domain-containing protein n=1 Tax=Rufibacter sediminis TaxID=2762756 RepID=A0ABR6VW94_9BACT|nr:hypothetical protein [Rufibacter sediminis]MBC3541215.1 hypothetical protein [Rufibacter sediminis]